MLARPFRSDGTSPSGAVCAPAAPRPTCPSGRAMLAPAASPAGLPGRKAKVAVHPGAPPEPQAPRPACLAGGKGRVGERARPSSRDLPFRRDEPAGDVGVGEWRRLVDPTFPLRRDKPVGGGVPLRQPPLAACPSGRAMLIPPLTPPESARSGSIRPKAEKANS